MEKLTKQIGNELDNLADYLTKQARSPLAIQTQNKIVLAKIINAVKVYTDVVIGKTYTNKRYPYFSVSDLNAKNDLIIAQRARAEENL